jgi:hypothetical protein
MLTTMTEEDWTIVLHVFGASRSRRATRGGFAAHPARLFLARCVPQIKRVETGNERISEQWTRRCGRLVQWQDRKKQNSGSARRDAILI